MASSLLASLPVEDLEEFAQHALTAGVSVDVVVDELVHLARDTGLLRSVPAPWRALLEDVGGGVLKIAIRWVVRRVARQLSAATAS